MIAGEEIWTGDFLELGDDGKLYRAKPPCRFFCNAPFDIRSGEAVVYEWRITDFALPKEDRTCHP